MNEKGQRYCYSDSVAKIRITSDEKELARMKVATSQDIYISTCRAENHPAFPRKVRVTDDALTPQQKSFLAPHV